HNTCVGLLWARAESQPQLEEGFSPVCTRRWRCRSEAYLNRFSQSGHLRGFSRKRLSQSVWREKPILHTPHTKGFCSTWMHWCSRRSVAWWKIFRHWVHWKERSWPGKHWCSWGLDK
uniref:Uncharacterized protein n=1 Tax=Apteryx owenii TaxID=8824 RepID=A0A8B9QPX6_APTOW